MKILVLDATYDQKVALLDNEKIISHAENSSARADFFMKLVDEVLKNSKNSIDDLDAIAVNVGPGSFTGIRVAVSVAKGLAVSKKIPLVQFNSFDYFSDSKNVILPGFSNFVYLKNNDGKISCENVCDVDRQFVYSICDDKLENFLRENQVKTQKVDMLSFEKIPAILQGKLVSLSEIRPLYLRKSQAEIQRENKISGAK